MSSVSGVIERLSSIHDTFFAVTDILCFTIAHGDGGGILSGVIFTPDSDKKSLLGLGNASTTTTLSTKDAEFNTILLVVSEEHVLLVADSNTALLSSFTVSTCCLHEGGVLIAGDLLGSSILLWLIELISRKLELRRGSPSSAVMTVDAGVLVDIGESPSVSIWVEKVLNLMHVSIPGHEDIS